MHLKIEEGGFAFLKLKIEICGAVHIGNVWTADYEKTEVLRIDTFATGINPKPEHFQSNCELLLMKSKADSSSPVLI